jgi:hypothetical protein
MCVRVVKHIPGMIITHVGVRMPEIYFSACVQLTPILNGPEAKNVM